MSVSFFSHLWTFSFYSSFQSNSHPMSLMTPFFRFIQGPPFSNLQEHFKFYEIYPLRSFIIKMFSISMWQSKDLDGTWLGLWGEAMPHCDSVGWGLHGEWCEPDFLWTSLGHRASGTQNTHVFILGLPWNSEDFERLGFLWEEWSQLQYLGLILLFSKLPWP